MDRRGDITIAIRDAKSDPEKAGTLIDLVYDQLRSIAQARMSNERVGHTLEATSLVHEACIRLLGSEDQSFDDRAHFFRAAATAMQRVLIDHARGKNAEKRGGGAARIPLDVLDLATDPDPSSVLALDDALRTLEREDPQAHEVVRLRFFAGVTVDEAATIIGISPRSAAREWSFARARLVELLGERS